MRDERFSVLWLCGPPGAGKSAVGWALYDGLARSRTRAGFVDIDQLGMCLPTPPDDPERFRLKERNVSAVTANFREAGCGVLVVSGDLGLSTAISSGTVPGASLTICRLRASPGELRRRLTARGAPDLAEGSLREAEELDRSSLADVCVDTDGMTVSEVARLVRERCGGWPSERAAGTRADAAAPAPLPVAGADFEVLLVCGAAGVGKSAVGFEVYLRQLRAGLAAAYLDLGQVGFMSAAPGDPGGHRLRARNLADLWRAYHDAGARRLVLSGPVPDARAAAVYAAALPAADLTVCRLHAGPAELARRISRRGQGLSWPEPGDPLIGQPEGRLRLAAERAAADAETLDRSDLGDLRIDTDGLSASEAADLVSQRWQTPLSREQIYLISLSWDPVSQDAAGVQRSAQVGAQVPLPEQPQHCGLGLRARPSGLDPVQQPADALARPDLAQDRGGHSVGRHTRPAVAGQEPDVRQQHRVRAGPDLVAPAAGLEQPARPGQRLRHRGISQPGSGLDVHHLNRPVRVHQ